MYNQKSKKDANPEWIGKGKPRIASGKIKHTFYLDFKTKCNLKGFSFIPEENKSAFDREIENFPNI